MTTADSSRAARHRERMRFNGLRPVQLWVPDTRSDEFKEALRQQCLDLRGDPAEAEVLTFTEAAASLL